MWASLSAASLCSMTWFVNSSGSAVLPPRTKANWVSRSSLWRWENSRRRSETSVVVAFQMTSRRVTGRKRLVSLRSGAITPIFRSEGAFPASMELIRGIVASMRASLPWAKCSRVVADRPPDFLGFWRMNILRTSAARDWLKESPPGVSGSLGSGKGFRVSSNPWRMASRVAGSSEGRSFRTLLVM